MQIGFVGLGTMGGPMARRLAAPGRRVSADVVRSSLPDPAAVTRLYEHWTGVTVRRVTGRDGARDA